MFLELIDLRCLSNPFPLVQHFIHQWRRYTWTSICPDTKLVPSFMVGKRDAEYAHAFIQDWASRLANRVQLTTDGHKPYIEAVEGAFGGEIDYAMLVKHYSNPGEA